MSDVITIYKDAKGGEQVLRTGSTVFTSLLPQDVRECVRLGLEAYDEVLGDGQFDWEEAMDNRFCHLMDVDTEAVAGFVTAAFAADHDDTSVLEALFDWALRYTTADVLDWMLDNADEFLVRRACACVMRGTYMVDWPHDKFVQEVAGWRGAPVTKDDWDEVLPLYETDNDVTVLDMDDLGFLVVPEW